MIKTALRVILIGGTSNVGKSTLAQFLSARLGWQCASTDYLARHPGRPWGHVRSYVAEHYLSLSTDELIDDVMRHYLSLWPDIRNLITTHVSDPVAECLVLEGSALWPESVVTLDLAGVGALWLTASDGFLQERIYQVSGFDQAAARDKAMIEKFVRRTQRYNQKMMQVIGRLGLPWINVETTSSLDELMNQTLSLLGVEI
jgi:2-phosphoglycerate kinase